MRGQNCSHAYQQSDWAVIHLDQVGLSERDWPVFNKIKILNLQRSSRPRQTLNMIFPMIIWLIIPEIDGLYLLEHLSVLLRAVFKVITTSPEDKDGHMYTAKEFLRLKLRRRWPQRNIRAVWFLFVQSSLPRLSRSLCWPWLCDFVWKCDFVWPKYFPLSYFDNVLALGSRLPRTHSGRRTHWCPILNRTSQLSDYSLVFVWLPLVILYAWCPSNDVQEHDICHHLR